MYPIFWDVIPPPNNEHDVGSWRPVQNNRKKKKKKKKNKNACKMS